MLRILFRWRFIKAITIGPWSAYCCAGKLQVLRGACIRCCTAHLTNTAFPGMSRRSWWCVVENSCCDAGPHEKVPGRRGRPPGSKNKRTLAMESLAQQGLTAGQQQAAMALLKQRAEQKRVEDEQSLQACIASGQKRRGRPPGSRNRPREDGMKHSYWWFDSPQLSFNLQAHLQCVRTGNWHNRACGKEAVSNKLCDLEAIKKRIISSFCMACCVVALRVQMLPECWSISVRA